MLSVAASNKKDGARLGREKEYLGYCVRRGLFFSRTEETDESGEVKTDNQRDRMKDIF